MKPVPLRPDRIKKASLVAACSVAIAAAVAGQAGFAQSEPRDTGGTDSGRILDENEETGLGEVIPGDDFPEDDQSQQQGADPFGGTQDQQQGADPFSGTQDGERQGVDPFSGTQDQGQQQQQQETDPFSEDDLGTQPFGTQQQGEPAPGDLGDGMGGDSGDGMGGDSGDGTSGGAAGGS